VRAPISMSFWPVTLAMFVKYARAPADPMTVE
jgi:hypothetical protein